MRKGHCSRRTAETDIVVAIDLDGSGKADIDTSIPFLDHMLNLFARHGLFDLSVRGRGDTAVDDHHLVEDLGICLGKAIGEALGQKTGIERYGSAFVPMDETLARVVVDLSGRSCLAYRVDFGEKRTGAFDAALLREFFKALADNGGMTLHVSVLYGENGHHMAEAVFKAAARALRHAVRMDGRIEGVLSTKGTL